MVRALWAGETVTHDGLVRVAQAKLYTRPATPPRLGGTAVSPESAAFVGGWADGLITVNQPEAALRRVVEASRGGGGAGKPRYLQAYVSDAADEGAALAAAHARARPRARVRAGATFTTSASTRCAGSRRSASGCCRGGAASERHVAC